MLLQAQVCGLFYTLLSIFIKHRENECCGQLQQRTPMCFSISTVMVKPWAIFCMFCLSAKWKLDYLIRNKNWVLWMLVFTVPGTYSCHWIVCEMISMVSSSHKMSIFQNYIVKWSWKEVASFSLLGVYTYNRHICMCAYIKIYIFSCGCR